MNTDLWTTKYPQLPLPLRVIYCWANLKALRPIDECQVSLVFHLWHSSQGSVCYPYIPTHGGNPYTWTFATPRYTKEEVWNKREAAQIRLQSLLGNKGNLLN
jgi:hypothetical protein